MSLDRRDNDATTVPVSKRARPADYFGATEYNEDGDYPADDSDSRNSATTATPMSPLSHMSVASSSTWAGETVRDSEIDNVPGFNLLKQPVFNITPIDIQNEQISRQSTGESAVINAPADAVNEKQQPQVAHLQAPQAPITGLKRPRDGKSPAERGNVNPFDDSYAVLENPTPTPPDAVRLPNVRVVDPERKWRGQLKGPRPGIVQEDDIIDDVQTAVPIGILPPAVRVLPDGTERLPNDRPAHGQSDIRDAPAPLTFSTTQLPAKPRLEDPTGKLSARGRRNIKLQKHAMQASQLGLNGFCIFATWWWTQYYYILLPLITATVALNIAMIGSLIFHRLWRKISPETKITPEEPESMVLLIPCYNETKEELERSLDSLVSQSNIEHHKQAIMIICDGKVRGPGMAKTTADYLLEDILTHKTSRKYIHGAYTAWDQQPMDVVLQRGTYQGLPYICMVKQQNQGKRDGLIVVRSFLYNFNRRAEQPATIFTPQFFNELADFLLEDANIENVVHLIGMDADTVFDKDCISALLEESRYPKTVGVCGYVAVDWMGNNWNLWKLYQSAEYTIAQALRRLHQSTVTHKVSCLPGCCQLLKICEETCGDFVLLELFGYCPEVTDGLLKQIRATASEDRNHVCHMLSVRPNSETRQALRARAFTDVPASWSVFLSQRRRWTLGATSNDLLLVTAPGVQWFERILAMVNVETWFLNPFIFASFANFIRALTVVPVGLIMAFVSVMLIPIIYYLLIPVWLCKRWTERFQFWAGCAVYIFLGPFLNISVLLYAVWNMDSFGWGKTRKVIADPESSGSEEVENEKLGDSGEEQAANTISTSQMFQVSSQTRRVEDEEKTIGL